MTVVVVGASLAGLRTVEALRKRGYEDDIVLVGDEPTLPYDRPPLSKEHLDENEPNNPVLLRKESAYAELGVDLRLGVRATGVELDAALLHTDQDESIRFDHLVIATGGSPRRWTAAGDLTGFHVLRTLADANTLRDQLDRAPRVAVLGGGFIGAEVACAARKRGLDVTIIEALQAPLSRALGPQVGRLLTRNHYAHGVAVHCGVTVTTALGADRVEQLTLSDETVIEADLVVVGLGVEPATSWLEGSGIDISNGVLCDSDLRVTGTTNVYAAGDVARWPNKAFDETMRVEHWSNATEHAEVVAASILGSSKPSASVPYVWSDQYGDRIQIVGRPRSDDDLTLLDETDGRHLAAFERDGRLVGVMAVNSPRRIIKARRAILSRQVSAKDYLASL